MGIMSHARRFDHVSVGMCFEHGGNLWRKRSRRTAVIVASLETVCNPGTIHRRYAGTWFWFSGEEEVNRNVRPWMPHTRRSWYDNAISDPWSAPAPGVQLVRC